MPELPEVEVIRRGLRPHIIGRKILACRYSGKKLRTAVPITRIRSRLVGSTITDIGRRAKYLLFTTSRGDTMIVHLGMTGKLGIFPQQTAPAQHDHLFFLLDDTMEMRFNDTRRFGSVTLIGAEERDSALPRFFAATGPEPWDNQCTAAYLFNRAKGSRQPVKSFIMNAGIIAGVGNIYANESLFAAGIHPLTPADRLSKKKWQRLLESICEILDWAIECGGSTISDFLDASGQKGYFQINFRVYGRQDQPCHRCETLLTKQVVTGRATYFCPNCQKRR